MLNTIQNQMKNTPGDWHQSYAMEIKRRTGANASETTVARLKAMVLAFPDMAAQIRSWVNEPGRPAALRRLHEFIAAYIYNPQDVVPDTAPGLFGYLDDAYLTARIYEATVLSPEWDPHLSVSPSGLYEKELASWMEEARQVMPRETAKIDAMLSLVAEGVRRTGLRQDALSALE
jgi:uncharacterized membrane protein YkvA (DUF1232 family)